MISLKDLKENKTSPEVFSSSKISIDDLEQQLNDAIYGKAKVDKCYVGLGDSLQHLFEYKYNYLQFLENIAYVIKQGKLRKSDPDSYKSKHKPVIKQ